MMNPIDPEPNLDLEVQFLERLGRDTWLA